MATKPDKILIRQIQMRRDTPANWMLHDPILEDGEMGIERDPLDLVTPSLFKIGDGTRKWSELGYGGLRGQDGLPGKDAVVAISTTALNRLEFDENDALYVPELKIDLVDIYVKAKNGETIDLATYQESEKLLGSFAQTLAADIVQLKNDVESASVITVKAGAVLSALTAVYERNGVVLPLDYRDTDNIDYFLGITTKSATTNANIQVQRSDVIEDNFWSFVPGRVYLGVNGTLTQTHPTDGFDLQVGVAVSPTRLVLNIQDPIELE
jgi:hypothetical protein